MESWKTAIDYLVLRLTPIQGFKPLFHTREVTFPFNDPEDLTAAQSLQREHENAALVRMFEARHVSEHNSRSLSSNEHIDLPVRPTITEYSENYVGTTYFSDQEDLMELMYIADTPAQQRHIRLFLNREYARRIEWPRM